jgi:NADH:ubiquinone oxidoreductase subunit H
MLLMFFLCEYLHLIIASIHFCLFFMGGWLGFNYFMLLYPFMLSYNDVLILFL